MAMSERFLQEVSREIITNAYFDGNKNEMEAHAKYSSSSFKCHF